jgi:hypothetical protein
VGRCGQKWEVYEGEDAVLHLWRLAREEEELRENKGRHELGEEGTHDSIITFEFMDDIHGQAKRYAYGFAIDIEDLKIGPHLMPWYRRYKEKQRRIAERESTTK